MSGRRDIVPGVLRAVVLQEMLPPGIVVVEFMLNEWALDQLQNPLSTREYLPPSDPRRTNSGLS